MASASQFASVIRGRFFEDSRGELFGRNDNGVPIRLALFNIFDPLPTFNEDPTLIDNAFGVSNPYEFVGSDSSAADRTSRTRFTFNYFRLGDAANSEQPFADVQRRLVLVNGSTSELLFSLTPVGTGGNVIPQIDGEAQTIINAINSVELTPEIPDDLSIQVSQLQVGEEALTIQFETTEGLTGFSILASTDLAGDFSMNLTDNSVITETSPGSYQAVIDNSDLPDSLFICIQL